MRGGEEKGEHRPVAPAGRLPWARRRWRRLSRKTLQLHGAGGEKLWRAAPVREDGQGAEGQAAAGRTGSSFQDGSRSRLLIHLYQQAKN